MPEIVLKDRDGNPVSYTATAIKVPLADGTEQMFLPGESQEKTVDADFSSGNMEVVPDDGKLLTAVTITKPANLIPDNIIEGVDIAGVVGTSKGGGSIEWEKCMTYFRYTIDPDAKTITLYTIDYAAIYADTGSYDVTIPDTINGLNVIIASS